MGGCIFKLISHKGYEKLAQADKYKRLHDIPIRELLADKNSEPETLEKLLENKKAILCVNFASK